jgi:hypothetical protein
MRDFVYGFGLMVAAAAAVVCAFGIWKLQQRMADHTGTLSSVHGLLTDIAVSLEDNTTTVQVTRRPSDSDESPDHGKNG